MKNAKRKKSKRKRKGKWKKKKLKRQIHNLIIKRFNFDLISVFGFYINIEF